MPIIGATQIQPVNFLESYARGRQLGEAERALQQQEVDRIRNVEQQRLLNQLYSQSMTPTGTLDMNALGRQMITAGMGAQVPALQAQQAEIGLKTAQARKAESEVRPAEWKQFREELAALPDNDQARYQSWAAGLLRRAPWAIDFLAPTLTADSKRQMLMTADAALPKGEVRDIGGGTATIDPFTGKQIGATIANIPEPEAVVSQKVRIGAAGAPQTRVQAFVPASETIQVEAVKKLTNTYDQLKTAKTDIANLARAAELSKTEARKYMGTGGQAFLSAAKFLKNRLGVDVDTKAIVNAEAARTALFQNVLNNLRKLDAQPSQQQQQIMQEALGNLDTDPDALPTVVSIYEDVIRGRVEQHNAEVAQIKANKIPLPYDLAIQLPERAAPPAAKPPQMSAEDKAALDWAKNNPRDPRAAQIKQRLGVR